MSAIFHDDIANTKALRGELEKLLKATRDLIEYKKSSLKDERDAISSSNKIEKDRVTIIQHEKTEIDKLIESEKKIIKSIKDNEKAVEQNERANKKRINSLREANTIAQKEARTIDEMRKKVSALNLLWKNSTIGSENQKKLAAQLSKTTAELKKQEAAVGIHSRNVGNYASAIKNNFVAAAAAITGVIVVMRGVFRFFNDAVQKAGEQEKVERSLTQALGYRSAALIKQASALQKVTTFGDEATMQAQAYLAMMGLEEMQIKKLIPVIQDFAAAKGMDLAEAADLVAKSVGSSTNALARYGINIEGAAGSSERMESAVDNLTKKFGGQAVAIGDVGVAAIQKFDNAWGDFKEKIGTAILPTIVKLTKSLQLLISTGDEKEILKLQEKITTNLKAIKLVEENNLPFQERSVQAWKDENKEIEYQLWLLKSRQTLDEAVGAMQAMRLGASAKIQKYLDDLHIKQQEDKKKREDEAQAEALKRQKEVADAEQKYWDDIKKNSEKAANEYRKLSKERIEIAKLTQKELEKIEASGDRLFTSAGTAATTSTGMPSEAGELAAMGGIPDFAAGLDPDEIMDPDGWQGIFGEIAKYAQLFGGAIMEVLSMVQQANRNAYEEQIELVNNRYSTEEARLNEQLRNKSISENEYNVRKIEAERKRKSEEAKIQKEYAKKQKNIAYTQSIINTALGVTNALATVQPFWLAIIMAVIAAALGAAEISTISSQQFAKGGHMKLGKDGSVLKGKRHEQGGVNLGEVGTAEAGEYMGIINRQATAKYSDILPTVFDSLNQQKFENVFSRPVLVSVDSTYSKKMYQEMTRTKPETRTAITDKMIITQVGNHTVKTYL